MILSKWKNASSTQVGLGHQKNSEPCQDKVFYYSHHGTHVIALADGAGSKTHAHIGAEIVVKQICYLLAENFKAFHLLTEKQGMDEKTYKNNLTKLKKTILDHIGKHLNDAAVQHNVSVEELSSTLLFCAIYNHSYIVGHIGDGTIIGVERINSNYNIQVMSEPENGDRPNITFFITDIDAIDHLRISGGKNSLLEGILLISDGPSEILYPKKNQLNHNTIKLFENYKFLTQNNYEDLLKKYLSETISKFSSDDLSLNILYKEYLSTKDNISETYFKEFTKGISNTSQIDQLSSYAYYLDPSKDTTKQDLPDIDSVKEYLRWK